MKKLICAMLATLLLVGLAACSPSDESESVASEPISAPSQAAEPEPEAEPLPAAFLTGLEKTADYPEGQRIAAVMVNNISQARPQSGLSDAKILVEIRVEGGITRFMAMYEDYNSIPRVGPVRSARDQFFQMLVPTQGIYVHIGESFKQTEYKKTENYEELDINGDYDPNLVMWDQNRRAMGYAQEHTAYTDGEHIAQHIQDYEMDDERTYLSTYFYFQPYNEAPRVPQDGAANSVPVVHSQSYRTLFEYDAAANKYLMSMYNSTTGNVEATVDENNNQQLSFDNLLIMFTDIVAYPGDTKDLQRVEMGMGAGFYISQGNYEFVLWRKGGPGEPFKILNADKTLQEETPLTVNPGTSYVAFVDNAFWDDFYNSMTTGTAQATVASGELGVDEEQFDT